MILAVVLLSLTLQSPPKPPITLNANVRAALDGANKNLRIAQLERANLIWQIRRILQVPNDYEWDDASETFVPPPTEKAKP